MTNNDFKFETIGKQTPYRTPDDFFEKMQKQLMERTLVKRRRQLRWIRTFTIATSTAAVLAGCLFLLFGQQQTDALPSRTSTVSFTDASASYPEQTDRYLQSMSDEELAEWIEFSENDIFMNLY